MDVLLSGPEAAALCGVDTSTIRSWKKRGLISPAGLDERHRPLYAQLDVALAEHSTRRRARRRLEALTSDLQEQTCGSQRLAAPMP